MSEPNSSEAKDSARLEAFSDGVFAIAITLLVLNLKVPDHDTDPDLLGALSHMGESYVGFGLSFVTILIMWVNHHRLFRLVRKSDEWLLIANGFLLFVVTFVPFPTAVMSNWLHTHQAKFAVAFYSATLAVLALSYNLLWWVITHKRRLIDPRTEEARIAAITRRYVLTLIAWVFVTGVAFVSPQACLLLGFCLAFIAGMPGLSPHSRS